MNIDADGHVKRKTEIILEHKQKNLTSYEYVINREKVTVAPDGQYIVIRIDGRRFKGYVFFVKYLFI